MNTVQSYILCYIFRRNFFFKRVRYDNELQSEIMFNTKDFSASIPLKSKQNIQNNGINIKQIHCNEKRIK